jgi:hypothetical protein
MASDVNRSYLEVSSLEEGSNPFGSNTKLAFYREHSGIRVGKGNAMYGKHNSKQTIKRLELANCRS